MREPSEPPQLTRIFEELERMRTFRELYGLLNARDDERDEPRGMPACHARAMQRPSSMLGGALLLLLFLLIWLLWRWLLR